MNLSKYNTNNKWDYENGFYITSDETRINKLISHYEIYKKIIELPGEVLEFGVYKGVSLIQFASFRNSLETQFSRKIVGFDIFGKFPMADNNIDNEFINKFELEGGNGLEIEELYNIFEYKNFSNIELVKGDIIETLPIFINNNPELKISLLHIDVDVYKPTKIILELLFDKVVRGGAIVFDDYATVYGETKAVDEFLFEKDYVVNKLPLYKSPSFIIKK